jgi:hypothetical protein
MHKWIAVGLVTLTVSVFNNAALAEFYFGAKTGPMIIDKSGVDDPTNLGLMLGYELPVPLLIGALGVEGEVTRTVEDGSFLQRDVELDTAAAYAAFRTAGPVYFKARLGYADLDEEGISDIDGGTSAGVGVGLGLGLVQFELEFTVLEDDVGFFSLGVQF